MYTQDAAKARVKQLEGEVLGLLHQLRSLYASPAFSSSNQKTMSAVFRERSRRPALERSFLAASKLQRYLEQQIIVLRDEISSTDYSSYEAEFVYA